MPLTVQQWATVQAIHNFMINSLNVMDTATGWADYTAWAATNSGVVPTDADFAAWQLLTPADAIPTMFTNFLCDLLQFAADTHNAGV